MPRVRVTGTCGFVWKGEVVVPGQELECNEREAHLIVRGWGNGEYIDAPAPTRPGMVVNADPVADHHDPVIEPAVEHPVRRRKK